MSLDFSQCRLPPFKHQAEDVAWLLDRPYAFITNEMRTGKSKIVVDAMQFLFTQGKIDKVIVVAPAPVRDVWFDEQLGEISKHGWNGLGHLVIEFHSRSRHWERGDTGKPLVWITTNFEYLISKKVMKELAAVCGPRTVLVLDEASFIKNWTAARTKACYELRKRCGRVILMNGTPIYHSPLDLFAQGNMLHPSILGTKFLTQFKARYAVQEIVNDSKGKPLENPRGPHAGPVMKVVKWTNLDDLQRRFAHCTVRRLQAECLDVPLKLPPVVLTATLKPETWRAYKAMRDELVLWLTSTTVATSATAAVKALRLSQITGGFVGGVQEAQIDAPLQQGLLESLDLPGQVAADAPEPEAVAEVPVIEGMHAIGREKLDVLLWFIEKQLEADPNFKIVAWGRFRAEVLRAEAEVKQRFPQFETGVVLGGQKRDERARALSLLKPETAPKGPVFLAGIEGTGSFGLDMCAAHTCVSISSGYSPGRTTQTLDRVYGPNQKFPIAYYDIIAVGPNGQKTIDRDVFIARRDGQDIATWVAADWVRHLTEE